jgi:hypothetical protein
VRFAISKQQTSSLTKAPNVKKQDLGRTYSKSSSNHKCEHANTENLILSAGIKRLRFAFLSRLIPTNAFLEVAKFISVSMANKCHWRIPVLVTFFSKLLLC